MTDMPVLETSRLVIRPFVLADLPAVHRIIDAESSMDSLSMDERRQWLEWNISNVQQLAHLYQPPYGDRAVNLKSSGELIGACGLVPAMGPFGLLPAYQGTVPASQAKYFIPEVGLYYAFSTRHRGQGYASEAAQALVDFAFQTLHLRRIIATTTFENEASKRVMQHLGMRIEQNPEPEPVWFQVIGILDHP